MISLNLCSAGVIAGVAVGMELHGELAEGALQLLLVGASAARPASRRSQLSWPWSTSDALATLPALARFGWCCRSDAGCDIGPAVCHRQGLALGVATKPGSAPGFAGSCRQRLRPTSSVVVLVDFLEVGVDDVVAVLGRHPPWRRRLRRFASARPRTWPRRASSKPAASVWVLALIASASSPSSAVFSVGDRRLDRRACRRPRPCRHTPSATSRSSGPAPRPGCGPRPARAASCPRRHWPRRP